MLIFVEELLKSTHSNISVIVFMFSFSLAVPILLKLKASLATFPIRNGKSLARDTANEHALERHAAAVRQLSNGTNGDDLYIRIATVENTIRTVNSSI